MNTTIAIGSGSAVRIFNNTFFKNNSNTGTQWTEISTSETPNPYVTLRNNIVVDDAQAPDSTWNGLALCTNAALCDWWNVASGNNITGDAAPATGQWKSDIGPNVRGGGQASATEASLSFVNTTALSENLHLQTGSVAWNRAASLTGQVLGDIDAQARSFGPWDVGADELPASSAPPLIVWSDVAASAPRHLRYSTYSGGVWSAGASAVPGPFSVGAPLFSKVARTHPNGTRRAAVASEDDGGAGGAKLQVSLYDGTNWDNGLGAPFSDAQQLTTTLSTPMPMRYFDAAYEQLSGKLLVVSGANTDDTVNIWTYNGTAWSANLFATPGGNGQIGTNSEDLGNTFRWIRLEPRPGTDQIAFIGSATDISTSDSAVISAAIWNGATNTFVSKQTLSLPVTGPDGAGPLAQNPHITDGIDIDFVLGGANAGEAVAVWGTDAQLWRRIWNPGSGWGTNAMVQDLGGGNTLRWIRQKAASNGDDMILAIEDSSERIHTIRYDGNTRAYSAFQTHTTLAYANADLNRPFDVVWDFGTAANTVLLVYSNTTGIRFKVSGDGGVNWTVEQTLTTAHQAHWIQLERDPSNVVHLVIKDEADDLRAWKWTGGIWSDTTPGPGTPLSTSVETNGATQNVEGFAIATYPPVTITTAVKLQSFDAAAADRAVDLSWKTGSELDNQGFHVYRGLSADGPWTRLTASLIPGLGSSPLGKSYGWRDSGLVNGQRYYYRLEDVDTRSKSTFHGPVSAVPVAAPASATPDPDGARKRRAGGAKPRNECPAWVLTEYAASAPDTPLAGLECTKHGNPEATSLAAIGRDPRSGLYELRTGGFYAVHEPDGSVRAFVPGFDAASDPKAPALPVRRALVDAVVGRRARLAAVSAFDLQAFAGLRPASVGTAEMEIGRDGTVRARHQAVRAMRLSSGLVPQSVASLAGTVFQGEQKSAVVELTPLRYDARRGRLVLASRVRFRLDFSSRDPEEAGLGNRGRRRPRPTSPSGAVIAELHTSREGVHAVPFETLFPNGGAAVPDVRADAEAAGPGGAVPRRAGGRELRARLGPLLLRRHRRRLDRLLGRGRPPAAASQRRRRDGRPRRGSAGPGAWRRLARDRELRDEPLLPARPPRSAGPLAVGQPPERRRAGEAVRARRRGRRVAAGRGARRLPAGLDGLDRDERRPPPAGVGQRDRRGRDLVRRQARPARELRRARLAAARGHERARRRQRRRHRRELAGVPRPLLARVPADAPPAPGVLRRRLAPGGCRRDRERPRPRRRARRDGGWLGASDVARQASRTPAASCASRSRRCAATAWRRARA